VDLVKVRFELDVDEDGFPPISVERLNAWRIDDDTFELDNPPFFVDSVAVGGTIQCHETEQPGVYDFAFVKSESGNKSIAIIFIENKCVEEVYQFMKSCGCYCEYGEFHVFNMLAVSIDKDVSYKTVVSFLNQKEKAGDISYAELCI